MSNLALTRESLFKGDTLQIEKVELSNGYVYVREMKAHEKDVWEQSILKQTRQPNGTKTLETTLEDFRAKLAVVTVCNEKGELLFKQEDYKALSNALSASNMEKIVNVAQQLNAISQKERDEIVKNSETEQESNSSSSSVEE